MEGYHFETLTSFVNNQMLKPTPRSAGDATFLSGQIVPVYGLHMLLFKL